MHRELAPEDVAHLRRKYGEVLRLREASAANDPHDPRPAMLALAREFPGALREADELVPEELGRRVAALDAVLAGAEPDPWMRRVMRFHRLMRGALGAKGWMGRRSATERERDEEAWRTEARALPFAEDRLAWSGWLDRVARPPRGRLVELVFERMAAEEGVEVAVLRLDVFGEPARERAKRPP